MASITDWLPSLLSAYGAIALVLAILQAILFFMAISLCCAHSKEDDKNKVSDK
jgi:hypothetical protein